MLLLGKLEPSGGLQWVRGLSREPSWGVSSRPLGHCLARMAGGSDGGGRRAGLKLHESPALPFGEVLGELLVGLALWTMT